MCINRFNSIPCTIDSRLTGNMDILQFIIIIIIYPLILLRSASDMTSKVHIIIIYPLILFRFFLSFVGEVMSAYIDFLCFVFVYFLKVFTMNTEALLNIHTYIYIYIYILNMHIYIYIYILSRGEPESWMTWLKIQK